MKKRMGVVGVLLIVFSGIIGLSQIKYFKINKIVTVTGEILKISQAKDSRNQGQFVVLELKDKTNTAYWVEVSPKWFFNMDIIQGNKIKVTGALNVMKDKKIILTQMITYEGEIHHFRDKTGFPLWRGQRGRRDRGQRQRRQQGKF